MKITILLIFLLVLLTKGNSYKDNEGIIVIVDKVWPKGNPSQTYNYFSLPFCPPKENSETNSQAFYFTITGSRKMYSNYEILFKREIKEKSLCGVKKYTVDQMHQFKQAIDEDYYFLMHLDEIPLSHAIGRKQVATDGTVKYFLYTHLDFEVSFNGDKIIKVTIAYNHLPLEISTTSEMNINFAYSVKWIATQVPFTERLANYEYRMYPEELEIQWFSVINSLAFVIFLTCFLAFLIVRIVRKDFQRYEQDDDDSETGWKLIHGDIFRFPDKIQLLSAILGNGTQLFGIFSMVSQFALWGIYYAAYGYKAMIGSLIFIYVLTTGISGYVSGMIYKQLGGTNWVKNVFVTISLFAVPCFIVWSVLNTIAIVYGSTAAIPFKTIAIILGLYFSLSFPLTLIGAITAKNFSEEFKPPVRTKTAQREIPASPFYKGKWAQVVIAGFLPFSSIYVELYYVFASLWGYIMYTPYTILCLVFLILVMVTSCITIAMIYLQINQEDYHWWWRSILCGGFSSVFIFGYCVFYYYLDSEMKGFMQFSFYFGYSLLVCYAFFLMLSTVGFFSAFIFLRRIYSGLRID